MKRILLFTVLLLPAATAIAQPLNSLVYPSSVTQTEPVVTIHPTNPLFLFASARTLNTMSGFSSEGVYVSTDGGMTWAGSDTCTGELLMNHGGDPGVMVNPNGRLILTHIGFVFTGVYSHYSTDNGTTWSAAYTLTNEQPEDKGTSTLDRTTSSPFYGRGYAAWVNFVFPYPVLVARTTDAGTSWSTPVAVNNPPPARCSGGSVTTDRFGNVYVAWAGVTPSAPIIEDYVGFASSTDGGVTWPNLTQNAYDVNGINGTLTTKGNIRVNGLPQIEVDNSGGPRDGRIYIVTTERDLAPAGSDPDIILHSSTDGGTTWLPGIRVNQDAVSNGKIQYFPAMQIDDEGGIDILFYDDRNTTADSAEVWLARSTDGGASWTEQVVSTHRFRPTPIVGGSSNYQGDHIALLTSGLVLHAFWMDDFSGIYQVWHAAIDIDTDVKPDDSLLPDRTELLAPYPNPFNPATVITYNVSRRERVTLSVYDILGREVATLVSEEQESGRYSVTWDARNSAGGTYFVRLSAGQFSAVQKIVFMK